jgi:hypothetical protein
MKFEVSQLAEVFACSLRHIVRWFGYRTVGDDPVEYDAFILRELAHPFSPFFGCSGSAPLGDRLSPLLRSAKDRIADLQRYSTTLLRRTYRAGGRRLG